MQQQQKTISMGFDTIEITLVIYLMFFWNLGHNIEDPKYVCAQFLLRPKIIKNPKLFFDPTSILLSNSRPRPRLKV